MLNKTIQKWLIFVDFQIRGHEGRAGMAAILDPEESLNFKQLADGMKKVLPAYARPIFIRTLKELDMTGSYTNITFSNSDNSFLLLFVGTYKMKKTDLQKDGFDPRNTKDNIYYLDSTGNYTILNEEIYNKILDGTIRL